MKRVIEGLLPVEMQPFVVSPKAWIWKPWRPGLRPARVPVTVVGPAQFTIQIYLIWLTTVAGNKNPNHHGNHTLSKLTISLLTEVNSTRDFVTVTKNCHSLHHCSMWSEQNSNLEQNNYNKKKLTNLSKPIIKICLCSIANYEAQTYP